MSNIVVLLLLLLLSAFFSGSEIALVSVSRIRAEALLREKRRGARALYLLKQNPNRMLIVLLIGNNVVNIAASAIGTVLATHYFGELGPGLAVGFLTLLILIFGEITPKALAVNHATSISLAVAPMILFFGRLFSPIIWLLEHFTSWLQSHFTLQAEPAVTESEVVSMVNHGASEGTIEHDEKEMIQRIFAFDTLRVGDVMIPRSEVVSMEGSRTIRDALGDILSHRHSRIPLHTGDTNDITMVVHLRDILAAIQAGRWDVSLMDIAHPPMFVPVNQRVDELFENIRKKKERTIIVVGPFGNMRGLCTLEDLVEELVGEIYDDKERPKEFFHPTPDGELLVEGKVAMRRVLEYFGDIHLDCKPTDSVNEWILRSVERIPAANEQFVIDDLWVVVERASLNRIHNVRMALRSEVTGKTQHIEFR
ncbi:MAG: HlyC/CorC family transporter [Magnetococcales bacterium]|nr:HlyC/CorC family transporter [Magnetococcales bacterium]MBF0150123.1 HlyC/CorC family transporter [Magnetococcales bacterium]MBF0348080.1 HlyC/CorC family transporter [Magnetococcales bacterium]MBF0631254.1 HlyC/CorC family transporter [Magnetococcales bacterium]